MKEHNNDVDSIGTIILTPNSKVKEYLIKRPSDKVKTSFLSEYCIFDFKRKLYLCYFSESPSDVNLEWSPVLDNLFLFDSPSEAWHMIKKFGLTSRLGVFEFLV